LFIGWNFAAAQFAGCECQLVGKQRRVGWEIIVGVAMVAFAP
jgi:hypothetical protein